MSTKVSIVMNAYNKYPQVLYSLYALENQTFDHNEMEVIVVDDASSDETPLIANYNPSFKYQYIRCEENTGRSKAKNIGINASSGEVVIILDSEMIVDPEFVEQHYLYHQQKDRLLVTGCMVHNLAFTTLNKDFNIDQLKLFHSIIKANRRNTPIKNRELFYKPSRLHKFLQDQNPLILINKNDISNLNYKFLSFPQPLRQEVIRKYGNEFNGYHLPWYCVVTHNISFKRELFDEVGGFYEGFDGWGFEDWEFGYRMYKAGAKIFDDPKVQVYHQEHPISLVNQMKENQMNYKKFLERHPHFDVGVHTLLLIGKLDFLNVNDIVHEYFQLVEDEQNKFGVFIQTYMEMFDFISDALVNERNITNLLGHILNGKDNLFSEQLFSEMNAIRKSRKYPNLIENFNFLIKL